MAARGYFTAHSPQCARHRFAQFRDAVFCVAEISGAVSGTRAGGEGGGLGRFGDRVGGGRFAQGL
jgi:hypothetical protein